VKIVLESDDRETAEALRAAGLPAYVEIVVAPPGAPRTKPRALNVALPTARGRLLTIFDAEDRPEPSQLRMAAETFAAAGSRLACLQARLAIDNGHEGWLAYFFAIGYAALFDVINPGLAALGLPMPLGGTSNHFRTDILRRVVGWDAWNVTEDADLGLRFARLGYQVGAIEATTYEDAPLRLGNWLGQRTRWMKGWMQTTAVFLRAPRRHFREIGSLETYSAFFAMASLIAGPLFGPFYGLRIVWDMVRGDLLAPAGFPRLALAANSLAIALFGALAFFLPALVGMHEATRR
jgi:cellulose synthase/poly-beta-1,6-N-acetylglucosamine synthase-like glycosyltransferase